LLVSLVVENDSYVALLGMRNDRPLNRPNLQSCTNLCSGCNLRAAQSTWVCSSDSLTLYRKWATSVIPSHCVTSGSTLYAHFVSGFIIYPVITLQEMSLKVQLCIM